MLCILLCILNSHWIIQFELETNFFCGSPYSCKKQESILFLINTYKIWILITIRSLLDCWGLRFRRFWRKRCFFHEFLWFWQFFTNFSYSSSFAVILWWAEAQRKRQICDAHAQNYGEWWRIGEIREKLSKSKKFVKKHLFRQNRQNLSPQQSNKLAQNYGEWWRIEEICEKLSKSKKFVKKTPFSSKLAKS